MAKYIDADELTEEIKSLSVMLGGKNVFKTAKESVLRIIDDQPTADVVEVKHGEWIPVQYTYFGLKRYECSECKDDEYWQKRYLEHKEKYCPNCGAKMDVPDTNDGEKGETYEKSKM